MAATMRASTQSRLRMGGPARARPCVAAAANMDRRAALASIAVATAAGSGTAAAEEAVAVEYKVSTNGLKWRDLKEGAGPTPAPGSIIRAHYTGRLASNGVVFDSSYERGRPLSFKIGAGEVIRGWDLGILGNEELGVPPMHEGGVRQLIIPSELAYGKRGAGRGLIPPDAVLDFTVELLGRR